VPVEKSQRRTHGIPDTISRVRRGSKERANKPPLECQLISHDRCPNYSSCIEQLICSTLPIKTAAAISTSCRRRRLQRRLHAISVHRRGGLRASEDTPAEDICSIHFVEPSERAAPFGFRAPLRPFLGHGLAVLRRVAIHRARRILGETPRANLARLHRHVVGSVSRNAFETFVGRRFRGNLH
jgi:hypothetical protein